MSIGLKVGEVDPSGIIMDVVNLPDPVYLGLSIVAYNYDDVGLYFKITGSKIGWTFDTVTLGLIASGGNLPKNLDNFCNRARPTSETAEQITVTLKAYTDSGYTDLKWTYTKTLDVWFIKSNDGSWTQDFLNNFDDGTVQTWAVALETSNGSGLVASTEFALSPAYSLRMAVLKTTSAGEGRVQMYKSFALPNRANVLGIFDIRLRRFSDALRFYPKYVDVRLDDTVVLRIGVPYNTTMADDLPRNKWMRLIVPLPANVTKIIRIRTCLYMYDWGADGWFYTYMDDFRIISRG